MGIDVGTTSVKVCLINAASRDVSLKNIKVSKSGSNFGYHSNSDPDARFNYVTNGYFHPQYPLLLYDHSNWAERRLIRYWLPFRDYLSTNQFKHQTT